MMELKQHTEKLWETPRVYAKNIDDTLRSRVSIIAAIPQLRVESTNK